MELGKMMRFGKTPLLAALAFLFVMFVARVLASDAPPPKPCQTDEHRAFDFWLGKWEVTTPARPDRKVVNRITRGNDGCSVHESL